MLIQNNEVTLTVCVWKGRTVKYCVTQTRFLFSRSASWGNRHGATNAKRYWLGSLGFVERITGMAGVDLRQKEKGSVKV